MSDNDRIKTRLWLKELFKKYYNSAEIIAPKNPHQREFGFGSFAKKIAIRHRAFEKKADLEAYLKREVPAHVNHSTAYYRYPDADMNDKERLGGDLVFDIDVGDLNLDCAKKHGSWVCDNCFDELKGEALKLFDFLVDDFGFDKSEITANFSGSRGYHLRIEDEVIFDLDETARKEIVRYLSCDMDLEKEKVIYELKGMIYGPDPNRRGLRGRIARTVIERVKNDPQIYNSDQVVAQIKEGNWGAFPKGYGIKKIINFAKSAAISIPIDTKVTTDMSHLIRMPDTLHGGSSMLAKRTKNLDNFDPTKECFVFGDDTTQIDIIKAIPEFCAKDQTYGPYKEGKHDVPEFIASYLCCKELANKI